MNQLTIRNFPKELERRIRALAKARGWSMNKAAVQLMKQGAGLGDESEPKGIGDGLDSFVGSWGKSESEEFDKRIGEAFESVDEELWR
jgi:plasmid stability protein